MVLIILVMIYIVLCPTIGVFIGETKGRSTFGLVLGLLFGPFGWIAVGLIEPTEEEAEARRMLQARAIASAMASAASPATASATPASGAAADRVALRAFLLERDVDPKDVGTLMQLYGLRSMPSDLQRVMDDAMASELTGAAVRDRVAEVLGT